MKTLRALFIISMAAAVCLCTGCDMYGGSQLVGYTQYPTIYESDQTGEYGCFGVNDILLGAESDLSSWSDWGFSEKGIVLEDNSRVAVTFDSEGRVVHIEGAIYDKSLRKYPLYLDGEKIYSVDKFFDMDNIWSGSDTYFMDGKVLVNIGSPPEV